MNFAMVAAIMVLEIIESIARSVRTFVRRRRIVIVTAVITTTAWLSVSNYTAFNEVGIAWNRVTGTLWIQAPGVHFTWPWVAVSAIDTRPVRVCVTSAGKGFSCKLVRFIPGAYREFVATEGHYYYWFANRISFNFGYSEEYRGMKDLMRGYAYGSKVYAFIAIDSEAM